MSFVTITLSRRKPTHMYSQYGHNSHPQSDRAAYGIYKHVYTLWYSAARVLCGSSYYLWISYVYTPTAISCGKQEFQCNVIAARSELLFASELFVDIEWTCQIYRLLDLSFSTYKLYSAPLPLSAAFGYTCFWFLPRCMECRRGLAMRILSVCLFVWLSNAWIVTKGKKDLSRFFMPYERSSSLVFGEEEWLGATPSTWNFGSAGLIGHYTPYAV